MEARALLVDDAYATTDLDGYDTLIKLGHTVERLYRNPSAEAGDLAGEIAYALTKRMVIDMSTARAAVDEALLAVLKEGGEDE